MKKSLTCLPWINSNTCKNFQLFINFHLKKKVGLKNPKAITLTPDYTQLVKDDFSIINRYNPIQHKYMNIKVDTYKSSWKVGIFGTLNP